MGTHISPLPLITRAILLLLTSILPFRISCYFYYNTNVKFCPPSRHMYVYLVSKQRHLDLFCPYNRGANLAFRRNGNNRDYIPSWEHFPCIDAKSLSTTPRGNI